MGVPVRIVALVGALGAATALRAAGIVNGDFETGTTAPWNAGTSTAPYGNQPTVSIVTPGPAPNTNGGLNTVYAGNYACQLFSGDGALSHQNYATISQSVLVDPSTTYLQFHVAAVLNGTHFLIGSPPGVDSYFELKVVDPVGAVLVQNDYSYGSSPATLVDDGVSPWKHLPWTPITVNLAAYVGQTVTIIFSAYDCDQGGHNCYAYVDGFALVPTPTATVTPTPTITPTFTPTPCFTVSPTLTVTPTRSPTFTPSPSFSITPTFTITPTFSVSPTFSATPSVTPTFTITQTWTPTPLPLLLTPHYPNPDPAGEGPVWLPYSLSVPARVDMRLYDVAGELVRTWDADPEVQDAGTHERAWDLRNSAGVKVASGVYLVRIRAVSDRGEEAKVWEKCAVTR